MSLQTLHGATRRISRPWPRNLASPTSCLCSCRSLSTSTPQPPPADTNKDIPAPAIFQLTNTTIFPFGVPSNSPSAATFSNLTWTISSSASWAILAPTTSPSRSALTSALLSQSRFYPPSSASYPILSSLPLVPRLEKDGGPRLPTVDDILQFVSFKTRLGAGKTAGEFEDYTKRYYAIREEDKLTLREHLVQGMDRAREEDEGAVDRMAGMLQVDHLLDLPLVTLSNGQTRRARILKALLAKPELLILEEPYTGLDVTSRPLLTALLDSLHATQSPRILLILRPTDDLPSFTTHVALLSSHPGQILLGPKEEVLGSEEAKEVIRVGVEERARADERRLRREEMGKKERTGKEIVKFQDVNVAYGDRQVLEGVHWTIREGERWVLSGQNGSGKSTLLALLLGDHPRSYMEDLTLFGKPRDKIATATLQENIGHVSPEIFNAFPRKWDESGLTVAEAINTGFLSIFSYRPTTPSQSLALSSLLTSFSHPLLTPSFLTRLFASLTPGEQSLVLLLRALVKKPKLLVLDEPFAGMDREMVGHVKKWLDEKLDKETGIVLVTHWEEEVLESCARKATLVEGRLVEGF